MKTELVTFIDHSDSRGTLVALEGMKNIPFEVKRVYYLTHLQPQFKRGFHAHKKLKQLLICPQGSCQVTVDDGEVKKHFNLSQPHTGLLVESCVWREMHSFSYDCVLLVLADEYFDESDYIRDYSDFLEYKKNKN
jgi:hypothetical protein